MTNHARYHRRRVHHLGREERRVRGRRKGQCDHGERRRRQLAQSVHDGGSVHTYVFARRRSCHAIVPPALTNPGAGRRSAAGTGFRSPFSHSRCHLEILITAFRPRPANRRRRRERGPRDRGRLVVSENLMTRLRQTVAMIRGVSRAPANWTATGRMENTKTMNVSMDDASAPSTARALSGPTAAFRPSITSTR